MPMNRNIEQPMPVFEPAAKNEAIKRLELHVIYQCSNACVFCNEADHMREFGRHPATMEDVEGMLRRYRAQGYEHVTFTGGEPTLFPKIWEALKLAKELGYRTFVISNGAAMSMKEFAQRALPYLDEVCLSIHGHDMQMHTGHTQNLKSFDRQKRTLEQMEAHPNEHFLLINCVVTQKNVPYLPQILKFLTGYTKVRHVLFSQLAPMGDAQSRYKTMAPKHSEILNQLPELNRIGREKNVDVRVCGIPVCLFGEDWRCANDLYFSPRLTVARAWNKDGTAGWFEEDGRRPELSRIHPPACNTCKLKGRCGGIYQQYWDQIEQPDLKPFDIEAAMCRS